MNDDSVDKQFDPWEIDKIQAEIDRNLNPPGEPLSAAVNPADNNADHEAGLRETVKDSIVTEDCGLNENGLDDIDFFEENVKSRHPKTFKRTALLVCAAAVLCGFSAGFAIFAAGALFRGPSGGTGLAQHNTFHSEPNFSFVRDMDSAGAPVQVDPISGVMSFADLIENVKPSVVLITAFKPSPAVNSFFTIPGAPGGGQGVPGIGSGDAGLVPQGGTGIIFDSDDERLFIVTNNHVIAGAERVGVSVQGAADVSAILVGRDVDSDLAVLSVAIRDIQALGISNFTIADFADSGSMRVGDFVIAVGNALGRGNSATFGFVSVVDKELVFGGRTFTVIQTDAAINPGNSGGPLLNLHGEVIGINMLKFVEASVEGTGYALTSNVAMPIIERIRNQTARPMLGIVGFDMNETVARAFSLPMMGIVIDSVMPGSGADVAGLRASDIITSFNGETVLNMSELQEAVQSSSVGDTVDVIIIRDGRETLTLQVTLLEASNTNF